MSATSTALRRRRVAIIAVAIGIAVLFAAVTRLGGDRWKEAVNSLPAVALIACYAVLPLLGFPATILLLAVGARFGFWTGLAVTATVIALHLIASYPLAGFVRRPITALLKKAGWDIPELDRRSAWPFSTWLALAPGLSYTLKNYMPALAGVPFSIYFIAYYPVHVATSVLGLLLGGAITNFSWPVAWGVLGYAIVMGILTKILVKRLRESRAVRTHPSQSPTSATT